MKHANFCVKSTRRFLQCAVARAYPVLRLPEVLRLLPTFRSLTKLYNDYKSNSFACLENVRRGGTKLSKPPRGGHQPMIHAYHYLPYIVYKT